MLQGWWRSRLATLDTFEIVTGTAWLMAAIVVLTVEGGWLGFATAFIWTTVAWHQVEHAYWEKRARAAEKFVPLGKALAKRLHVAREWGEQSVEVYLDGENNWRIRS